MSEARAEGVGVAVLEQFATADQQRHAGQLGMWAWLVTELLLFAGLFLVAVILRIQYPASVHAAVSHFKFWIGASNTAVLIVSSLTMSGAIEASRLGLQRLTVVCMTATAALGTVFLLLKGYEWYADIVEHMAPWLDQPYELASDKQSTLFTNLYWVTTGLHGLHLLTGVSILMVLALQARADGYLTRHQNRVEVFGLYWHFIDLIWIIVFPVLYVIGR
ncbi:MAG: cytochrome c oxidase subunit 3 [Janthinobacterium lividum]